MKGGRNSGNGRDAEIGITTKKKPGKFAGCIADERKKRGGTTKGVDERCSPYITDY